MCPTRTDCVAVFLPYLSITAYHCTAFPSSLQTAHLEFAPTGGSSPAAVHPLTPSTSSDIQLLHPFLFCPEGNGQTAHPKGKCPSPNKVQDDNPQWQHFLQPPQCHHKGTGSNAAPGDSADEGTEPDTPTVRICSKYLVGKAGPWGA